MMPPPLPRTLILDYYDSYTNNLLTLFTRLYSDAEVLKKVVVVKADHYTWEDFKRLVLPNIDCVILSPGPGRPDNPSDISFALDLLQLHPLPILGVCLGHQAIGVAFGAKIINTPRITHGHVIPVRPTQPLSGVFASKIWKSQSAEKTFEVVVYNSLTVDPSTIPDELVVTAVSAPTPAEKQTIQGLRHRDHPIWGVQYHPESISSTHGCALLHSFLDEVHLHHKTPSCYPPLKDFITASCAYRILSSGSGRNTPRHSLSRTNSQLPLSNSHLPTPPITPSSSLSSTVANSNTPLKLMEKRLGTLGRSRKTQEVFESLVRSRKGKEKAIGEVWLDGETASINSKLAVWHSLILLQPTRPTTTSLASPAFLVTYTLSTRTVTLHRPSSPVRTLVLADEDETFWNWFSTGQASLQALVSPGSATDSTWKGGWAGWFAYEMKQESLEGYRRRPRLERTAEGRVDAAWAWCDHLLERAEDGEWVMKAVTVEHDEIPAPLGGDDDMLNWLSRQGVSFGLRKSKFEEYCSRVDQILSAPSFSDLGLPATSFPTFHPDGGGGESYRRKIDECREAIRQGESYELTLTTSFSTSIADSALDPYSLYLRLRTFNPAYYSTYLSFPCISTHVLSSSPERFLRIDSEKRVEMKPIKGTRARVKVGDCVCGKERGCRGLYKGSVECLAEGREEDRRRGEMLQNDQKERAENLMIVDLIRSDLLSSCIPSTVTVPKLIALESYGVHNLVTTVQGKLADNVGSVEAVKRCFPPGSMTGAPKLRSVRLLDAFEGHATRGIYSGALGYFSLCGSADLSVVIRTIIIEGKTMKIGAGGAITWLSDRDGEWDEVLTKVKSVVGDIEGC
ncbi:para-aminobenzoate synthetase, partial [Tremellales sp. Uapishka_1]